MFFIAIAPKLLAATQTAMLLWRLATNGAVTFEQVNSCEHYSPCISVDQTATLKHDRVGETWKYENQYIILTLEADPLVLSHELGHVVLGLRYHSKPETSLMSPVVGKRCLTLEDAERYEVLTGRKLTLWCL